MSEKAAVGKTVGIYYRGGVRGEEPSDVRVSGEPLTVMLGDMRLPRGIEDALVGMKAGEEKTIDILCEQGYGPYQDKLAAWYPKRMLPEGCSLEVGDVLWRTDESGAKMPAHVTEMTQDNVKLDMNHPFAGKDLTYWLKLVSVR